MTKMNNKPLRQQNHEQELLFTFLHQVHLKVIDIRVEETESITSELIDQQLIQEIKDLPSYIRLEFGKSLRDIKCILPDSVNKRHHEIYVTYIAPQKLVVSSVALPHSTLQDREYKSVEEIVTAFKTYIDSLENYFTELESIDQHFTVMEPVNPTFKDDYRRIALDERTWLHIEVTQYGLATNIHLIAQSEMWQDKLHKGLMRWDHDKGIVENVMDIFDVSDLSQVGKHIIAVESKPLIEEEITCGICFCAELADTPGVPQPLCQNPNCGVYFHKFCLYQWLVACEGGRPPTFGVANGNCPTCLHPIACSEKDC